MKLLLADDHAVVRIGLIGILGDLGDELSVVEAASFAEALKAVKRHRDIDLIFAGLLMPGMPWEKGLKALHKVAGDIPIIVLSMVEHRSDVLRSIELGAVGYLSKAADRTEILKAVGQVLSGEIYLPKELISGPRDRGMMAPAVASGLRKAPPDAVRNLTRRQRQVLKLLGEGRPNSEIAAILGRSEHTIRIHVSAILKTLDVSNRTMAALIAKDCSPDLFG